MKQNTKVIFNEYYIDEITRHRDIAKRKYETENLPAEKERAKKIYDKLEQKLTWAEEFQDTIDQVRNSNIPNLTVITTMGGYEFPASYLQLV